MKQNTAEWLEWRRKHVGASDQTHLHWSAPWSIGWAALWDIKRGVAQELTQNPHMQRGIELENEARLAYSLEKESEFHPALVESQEYSYLSASLDARNDEGHIAEIKCPGPEDHQMALQGNIPRKYVPQLCHQLFVCHAYSVDYVSFSGEQIAIIPFYRDEKLIHEIMSAAHRFWAYLSEGQRPTKEWPHPDFDTRIPVIEDKALQEEANWNLSLRDRITEAETMLEESNKKILSLCSLPRAKVGKLQIITTERKGFIQYAQIPDLKDVDLEQYRGPATSSRSLRRIKE